MQSCGVIVRYVSSGLLAGVLGVASATASAFAQSHPAAKPAACQTPEYRQFDFWVGSWTVTTPDGKPAGTNTIDRLLAGCALQEHWVGRGGVRGTSFNIYNAATRRWHQTWIDSQGTLLLLDGSVADGKMTMTDQMGERWDGHSPINRITWQHEHDDSNQVRQIWDVSTDGGKTWTNVFNGLYARAKP